MRIRTIKPDFFKSDKVAELQPFTRLLFIGLWCAADRRGRLEDRPKKIHAELFPYDGKADVNKMLQELSEAGFIARYISDSTAVIQVLGFEKHQRISGKELLSESELPAMQEGKHPGSNGEATGKHPGSTREAPETAGKDIWIKERSNGDMEEGKECAARPPDPVDSVQAIKDRAAKLHNKRPSTPWDSAELRAWKSAEASVKATTEANWQLLEWFYALPQAQTFSRTALAQTLNNWNGEISKAAAYKAKNGEVFKEGLFR